jgi:hypothetical protein
MKKFLLLRSNKQSGPYSTEELQQMGLKPYDLIWVEGKSAAWRYPGEIEELKSFAPAVEEQPYDRFYKKHIEANGKEQSSAPIPIETPPVSQPAQQQQPVEKPARKKEYKRVFVTLPSGTPQQQQPVQKPAAETKATTYLPPVQQPAPEAKQSIPEPKPAYKESLPAQEPYEQTREPYQPKAPDRPYENKSYAQPKLAAAPGFAKEAVKENQTEIYYPEKRRFRGVPLAAMIIGMVVMAAIGIVIGMSLNGNKPFSLVKKVDPVPPANNTQQSATPADPRKNGTENSGQVAAQITEDSTATETQKQTVKAPVKKNTVTPDTNHQDIAANVSVKEEPEISKEEEPVVKEVPKSAPQLDKLVSVSNNDFEVGPFGGISRLALTLKNTSEYELSLVVVQLEYLKANKEVYKTENLYFRDVAANSTVTLDAPRSSRGNKINYRITLINSKDHIYHAGN